MCACEARPKECEDAVYTIRTLLTQHPILILPGVTKPFRLETDASDYGIGAVLSQEKEGFGYQLLISAKDTSATTILYSRTLAIVLAVEYFQYYLNGEKFIVITDHKPLLKTNEPASRLDGDGDYHDSISKYNIEKEPRTEMLTHFRVIQQII